ncbi:hypothetical protein [Nocardia sp. NPDC056100]|uniref:hypothetical protein n=1 Tax=Nocardia sp. NPDC056100 TaxID=3345712 RepID=UPI0035D662B4
MSDPADTAGTAPAQMHQIWIPSNKLMELDPDKYSPKEKFLLSKAVDELYRKLPVTYKTIFDSFGNGKGTPPPLKNDPPELAALGLGSTDAVGKEKGEGASDYMDAVSRLQAAFQNLKTVDIEIAPLAQKTAEVSRTAQQAMNDMIDVIQEKAKSLPSTATTVDNWAQIYLAEAADQATVTIKQAKSQYDLLGKGVADSTGKIPPDVEARLAKLEGKDAKADPPAVNPNQYLPGGQNGSIYTPPNNNSGLGLLNPGLNPGGVNPPPAKTLPTPDPTTPPTPDPTKPPGNSNDNGTRDPGNIGQPPSTTPPNSTPNQNPNMATPAMMGGGMGSGMDPMSMMLPSLMSAMQPNMNDRLQADPGRYDRYNDDPYDRYPQNAIPPQATPPAATPQTPTTTPPATTTAPPAPTDKPASAAPAGPVTPAPDADGAVDYPFPDGKTQRVSVIVAKALDKAFGNKKGTDAQAAYADTTAKWSDTKQIGDRVDPSQLMTGDVGVWESPDLVAIVRAMGSEGEASLDLIVNGELRRYPDQISETTGDLGKFVGWAHPRGIEITGTSAKHSDGAVPGINGPAAPMPVVAAPAS